VHLKRQTLRPSACAGKHLHNIRQLTFGGQNAEAYFSRRQEADLSVHRDNVKCDHIFVMNIDGSDQRMISTGKGRTTCSYFYPDGRKSCPRSTHLGGADCPPKAGLFQGLRLGDYPSYDIFTAHPMVPI